MRALLKPFQGFVLAASFAGFMASAQAVPISGTGTNTSFTGDFDFDAINDMLGTLTITLNNTSPATTDGFLTAFVFNNPDDKITGASLFSTTNANFTLTFGNNMQTGSPFGDFDFILSTTAGDFEGGGSPNGGIPDGGSATFVINLSGTMFLTLTEQDFFDELSSNPQGGGAQDIVARFRGLATNPDSEKVPGGPSNGGGGGGGTKIPEPTTALLLGLGLLGLALRQRRRG